MQHPINYKTQNGLVKALEQASNKAMTVKLASWFENAKFALRTKWGWDEKDAAVFVSRYQPHQSAYRASI